MLPISVRITSRAPRQSLINFMLHTYLWIHKWTDIDLQTTAAYIFQQAKSAWYQHANDGLGHIYTPGVSDILSV